MKNMKTERFKIDERLAYKLALANAQAEKAQAQLALAQQQAQMLLSEISGIVTEGGKYTWTGQLQMQGDACTVERTLVESKKTPG
jgi:hypothetical protein